MIFIFSMLLVLVAIIFFHYLEGLFSATLSAIFAVIAAVVAVGYHETIVESLLGGRFAAESHALVLMILFALVYLILRLVFDQLIKGNVRLPVLVDKIGASVMGLIVGIFALGVLAIAAQEMPFGVDVAGYSRYEVTPSRSVVMHVQGFRSDQQPEIDDELVSDNVGGFDALQENHLFPRMDDYVVDTVSWLSNGSLAGSQPMADIHPDLLQELFGQRLGLEPGANHSALNLSNVGQHQVSVLGVYTVPSTELKVLDQYDQTLRDHPLDAISGIANLDKPAKPTDAPADRMLLVVRTQFSHDAADNDIFRFSPGDIRLVAPQTGVLNDGPGDYYPIGTLELDKHTLYVDKPDDYLFVSEASDHAVDLVFLVDRWKDASGKQVAQVPPAALNPPSPSFLEVKRLARVDLTNMPIDAKPPESKIPVGVMHVSTGASAAPIPPPPGSHPVTPSTPAPPTPTPGQPQPPTGQPQPPPPSGNPLAPHSIVPGANSDVLDMQSIDVTVTTALPQKLGATAAAAKQLNTTLTGGSAILSAGKAKSLTIDGSPLATDASAGDVAITDLVPPKGQTLVRVTAKPGGDNSWAWASHVKTLTIVDAAGTAYAPKGVWATITIAGGEHLMADYAADYDLDEIPPGDGKVTSVVFYIAVPLNAPLKQLTLDGKMIKDLSGVDTSH